MPAIRLSDIMIGDVVTYTTSWWKPKTGERKTDTGTVVKLNPGHGKTGQVSIVRITKDGHQAQCSIPPGRIVGFVSRAFPSQEADQCPSSI